MEPNLYVADFQEPGIYLVTCDKGHRVAYCLQQQRFEVLFEAGLVAVADGYYREAVSSFATSLERFWEFFSSVITSDRGISEENWASTWKMIQNQSERQLGAFVMAHLLHLGTVPTGLTEKEVAFRNSVIHKGHIPQRSEAIGFATTVLKLVSPLLDELKEHYPSAVNQSVKRHVEQLGKTVTSGFRICYLSNPTVISVSRALSEPVPTLEEAIGRYERSRLRHPRG